MSQTQRTRPARAAVSRAHATGSSNNISMSPVTPVFCSQTGARAASGRSHQDQWEDGIATLDCLGCGGTKGRRCQRRTGSDAQPHAGPEIACVKRAMP